MADKKRRAARLKHFHRQGGKCFWCGCAMVLDEARSPKDKRYPDNLCTIDHLFDRHHPERQALPTGQRYVAACRKCNWERGRASHMAQPVEQRRLWASHDVTDKGETMTDYGHYWTDCDLCGRTVVCGKCGNNVCNGGHGTLSDGSPCDACQSAHEMLMGGETMTDQR